MTALVSRTRAYDTGGDALESCFELGWTDGLPVVPATPVAVEEMLAVARLAPDAVLGGVPTRNVTVTAEKVAINAVMAGCRPEYFPVVVAAVRALLKEKANCHSTTATLAGAAHAVIVNGPIREQIGVHSGQACFGPGFRANATIGRALRLVIRNVCRAVPGELDRATFSWPLRYSFCFGENEEASDWTPLHVELGYSVEDSVVTLQSVMHLLEVTDLDPDPVAILDAICERARQAGLVRDEWAGDDRSIVVVVGAEHQRRLLAAGWTKEGIQERLYPYLTAEPTAKYDRKVDLASPANVLVVAAGGPGIAQSWILMPHLAVPTHEVVAGNAAASVSANLTMSPAAKAVLDEMNEVIGLDGGALRVRSGGARVELELDLTNSTCPECVLPSHLLVEMLTSRLAEVDPGIVEISLADPRVGETAPPGS